MRILSLSPINCFYYHISLETVAKEFTFVKSFLFTKTNKHMESIKNKIQHLNQLVLEGKAMEAFDLYYDDDVIMQENQMPPTIGKEVNR